MNERKIAIHIQTSATKMIRKKETTASRRNLKASHYLAAPSTSYAPRLLCLEMQYHLFVLRPIA